MHTSCICPRTRMYSRFSCYLPEDFHKLWPKRLRAESTHPENWPKRPIYQGRNAPPPKLAETTPETTQAETTQAETTQGRNDPDSLKMRQLEELCCGDRKKVVRRIPWSAKKVVRRSPDLPHRRRRPWKVNVDFVV